MTPGDGDKRGGPWSCCRGRGPAREEPAGLEVFSGGATGAKLGATHRPRSCLISRVINLDLQRGREVELGEQLGVS